MKICTGRPECEVGEVRRIDRGLGGLQEYQEENKEITVCRKTVEQKIEGQKMADWK